MTSFRRARPFMTVRCGRIDETSADAETPQRLPDQPGSSKYGRFSRRRAKGAGLLPSAAEFKSEMRRPAACAFSHAPGESACSRRGRREAALIVSWRAIFVLGFFDAWEPRPVRGGM